MLDMKFKMLNNYIFIGLIAVVPGCEAGSNNFDYSGMKDSEKTFNEQQSITLVAFMSLDVMFPDERVRSLAKAAGKGKVKVIEKLVSQGVDVNSFGSRRATPLFWALKQGNVKGFSKLLELGANPNIVFDDGGTIIHWATENEDQAYLEVALKYDGNPNLIAGQFQQPPIFETIGIFGDIGKFPALEILLKAGADVNMRDGKGDTPLIVAAKFGRFDIVYKLLQEGADPNLKSSSGQGLLDITETKKKALDPNHELYSWLEKVEKLLTIK